MIDAAFLKMLQTMDQLRLPYQLKVFRLLDEKVDVGRLLHPRHLQFHTVTAYIDDLALSRCHGRDNR